ncbi:MAG: DUF6468 domain-containing protein [Pseudomonadota bacterium]
MSFAGLFIDLLVAGLLAVTIGYCALLNRRLKKMRADEDMMRAVITELVKSTETAERAILGLRATASECNKTISARIHEARNIVSHLDSSVAVGRQHAGQMRQVPPTAAAHSQANAPHVQPPSGDFQARVARQLEMGHEELSRRMAAEAQALSAHPLQPPQPVNDILQEPAQHARPPVTASALAPAVEVSQSDGLYGDLEASLAEIARRNRSGAAA